MIYVIVYSIASDFIPFIIIYYDLIQGLHHGWDTTLAWGRYEIYI